MSDAHYSTITELASPFRAKTISPVEIVFACLERIQGRRALNAFITVLTEKARQDAERADAEIRAGRWRGPWNSSHIPGGSSSGSAAATAAGLYDVLRVAQQYQAGHGLSPETPDLLTA